MRLVLDTNIIVSAFLGGALEVILHAFQTGKFELVVSQAIVDEYFAVLKRPKFQIEPSEFNDFAALLLSKAEFITPAETLTVVQSDPADNKFLEAALAGRVTCIVSGDNHLLELKTFRGIQIISARDLIASLKMG